MPLFGKQRKELMKAENKKTNFWSAGTKYRGQRSGPIASMLDGSNAANQVAARYAKYGGDIDADGKVIRTPGVIMFKAMNPMNKNEALAHATLNFGGRTFQADADGNFKVLDEKYLKDEQKLAQEIDEYANQITSYCLSSDETCATILTGGDLAGLNHILGSRYEQTRAATILGSSFNKHMLNLPDEILNANGMPSVLASIDSSSNMYGLGISKLKHVVKFVSPILENESKDNARLENGLDNADV